MHGADGFGAGGADPAAMMRAMWGAWGEAMRAASGERAPADPWQGAVDAWSQLLGGRRRSDASEVVDRFSAQARQWLGMMQQVAGQFAGREANPADVVEAWKQAMGGAGRDPFGAVFGQLGGAGHTGFDAWMAQVEPMLHGMTGASPLGAAREQLQQWLHLPTFGLAREHQERWQALASAQLALREKSEAYDALMLGAGRDAFERFERKLAERAEPGRQLKSARALFDLWVDAAEEAYAEVALSPGFRSAYGELVNAQMRVRAGVQREIELACAQLGMPTRTEVDGAHRRIAELERTVRRLQRGTAAPAAPVKRAAVSPAPKQAAPDTVASKQAAVKKPAPKTPAPKTPAKKTSAQKPAARQGGKAAAAARARPAARRAKAPAIAAIAMPEPLKPLGPNRSKKTQGKR